MVSDSLVQAGSADFRQSMAQNGWHVFPSIFPAAFVAQLSDALAEAYDVCRAIQVKNGLAANTDGSVHHLIGQSPLFLEVLERFPLWAEIESYFNGKFILNSFGGILNFPSGATYASKVHRDIRFFSGDMPLMLNMLVMLDDFTEENGATLLLSGSHKMEHKPDDAVFHAHASKALGSAGSVLLFNSNLWHAAGHNKTEKVRRCLTPTFTKPFMKQQCDYPRVLGYAYAAQLSDMMQQVLGYNSRVPASLEEWYQPQEKRMYKAGQD